MCLSLLFLNIILRHYNVTILFFEFKAVKSAEDHSAIALILFDHIIEKKIKEGF